MMEDADWLRGRHAKRDCVPLMQRGDEGKICG
jgi:hypothetical protein